MALKIWAEPSVTEIKASTPSETLEELLKRVTADGKIDKKELQDILTRKDIEAEGVIKATKDALNKLKTEGLEDILKNGLTLKQDDKIIMDVLKDSGNGYTVSEEIKNKFAALAEWESFVVSLEGKKVITGFPNNPFNDDKADIRKEPKNEGEKGYQTVQEKFEADNKALEMKRKSDAIAGRSIEEAVSIVNPDLTRYVFRSKVDRLGHLLKLSVKNPEVIKEAGFSDISALRKASTNAFPETEKHLDTMKNAQSINRQSEESMKITDSKDGTSSKYLFKTEAARKQYLEDNHMVETPAEPVKPEVSETSDIKVSVTGLPDGYLTDNTLIKQQDSSFNLVIAAGNKQIISVPFNGDKTPTKPTIKLPTEESGYKSEKEYTIAMSDDKKTVTFTIKKEELVKPAEVIPNITDILGCIKMPKGYSVNYDDKTKQIHLMKGKDLKRYFTVGKPENDDKKDAEGIQAWVNRSIASPDKKNKTSTHAITPEAVPQAAKDTASRVGDTIQPIRWAQIKSSDEITREMRQKITCENGLHIESMKSIGNNQFEVSLFYDVKWAKEESLYYTFDKKFLNYSMSPKTPIIITKEQLESMDKINLWNIEFSSTIIGTNLHAPVGKTYNVILDKGVISLKEPK